jgi:BirA family transcriptional regulator, biotin operon repressor / biotin---[acetyl-CoA-carboxylase] ligase
MIIGSNILFFKDLPSTNAHASLLLKTNSLPEGTIIHSNYQSAGKGYAGNEWESEDGKNLLLSIVLYPSFVKPSDQFCISMAVSLGICDFIRRFIPDCSIKWPNDIYIKNDKIAGVLLENTIIADHIEYSIAGIGININQEKFISPAPNPVSLRQITSKTYDLQACLIDLTKDLDIRYKQLIGGNAESVRKEYISKLYRLNEWSQFKDIDGQFTGRIKSIGDYGTLMIENQDMDIRGYAFKEVEFIL